MITNRNCVLLCTTFLLLKSSMVSFHMKLVKDLPNIFQNSDSIFGSPFFISRSFRIKISLPCSKMDGVCTIQWRSNVLLHQDRGEKSKIFNYISHLN